MSDIFISYANADLAQAQMLAKAFEAEGWSVWWDRKIPPGKTFREVIDTALEAAGCVIVLWSAQAVLSQWVIEEASEGQRRGILIPVLIKDDAKIPLGFRQLHAARLIDWQAQAGHLEFGELKAAITGLLGHRTGPQANAGDTETTRTEESKPSVTEVSQDDPIQHVPHGVYLDPETKLMWTIADNRKKINWHNANEYAKQLRLGEYSDWRLPTIDELEKLYDPKEESNIRKPFHLTDNWVWSSTKQGSASAWGFDFVHGRRRRLPVVFSFNYRALCVRRSGE